VKQKTPTEYVYSSWNETESLYLNGQPRVGRWEGGIVLLLSKFGVVACKQTNQSGISLMYFSVRDVSNKIK
jgi:hypothetical protein